MPDRYPCAYRPPISILLLFVPFIGFFPNQARAQDPIVVRWNDSTSGNFLDANLWNPAITPNNDLPIAGDRYYAILDAVGQPYVVTIDDNAEIVLDTLTIDSPDAELRLQLGHLTANNIHLNDGIFQFNARALSAQSITSTGGAFESHLWSQSFSADASIAFLDSDWTIASTGPGSARTLRLTSDLAIADFRTIELDRVDFSIKSLSGAGTINLSNGASILGSNPTGTSTLGPGLTIQLNSGSSTIRNTNILDSHVIAANPTTELTVVDVHNDGLISVQDGAVLFIQGEFSAAPDSIQIDNGSVVYFPNTQVTNIDQFHAFAAAFDTFKGDLTYRQHLDLNGETVDFGFVDGSVNINSRLSNLTLANSSPDNTTIIIDSNDVYSDLTIDSNVLLNRATFDTDLRITGNRSILPSRSVTFQSTQENPSIAVTGTATFFLRDESGIRWSDVVSGGGHLLLDEGIRIEVAQPGAESTIGTYTIATTLDPQSAPDLINRGHIRASLNSLLDIRSNQFRNEGLIQVDAGSTIRLTGAAHLLNLGTIQNSGSIELAASIYNHDGYFDFGSAIPGNFHFYQSSGRIVGGQVGAIDPFLNQSSIHLQDTVVVSDLFLKKSGVPNESNSTLRLFGTNKLQDASIELVGPSNTVRLDGTLTGNGTVAFGDTLAAASSSSTLNVSPGSKIDSNTTIDLRRGTLQVDGSDWDNQSKILMGPQTTLLFLKPSVSIFGNIDRLDGNNTVTLRFFDLNEDTFTLDASTGTWRLFDGMRNGRYEDDGQTRLVTVGNVNIDDLHLAGSINHVSAQLTLDGEMSFDDATIYLSGPSAGAILRLGNAFQVVQPTSSESHVSNRLDVVFNNPNSDTILTFPDEAGPRELHAELTARTGTGNGLISLNSNQSLDNRGTVHATNGKTITLRMGGVVNNFGTLRSQNGGTIATLATRAPRTGNIENYGAIELDQGILRTTSGLREIRNHFDGRIEGSGTVDTAIVRNEGALAVGSIRSQHLTFTGDYVQHETASLNVGIFGTRRGVDYGFLEILGDAEIGGKLFVDHNSVFRAGQEYTIVGVGGQRNGYFDQLDQGGLVGNFDGIDVFITYTANGGNDIALYTIQGPLPGIELTGISTNRVQAMIELGGNPLPVQLEAEIVGSVGIDVGQQTGRPLGPIDSIEITGSTLKIVDIEQSIDLGTLGTFKGKISDATIGRVMDGPIPVDESGFFSTESIGLRFTGGSVVYETTGLLATLLPSGELNLAAQATAFGREDLLAQVTVQEIKDGQLLRLVFPFEVFTPLNSQQIPIDLILTGTFVAEAVIVPECSTLAITLGGSLCLLLGGLARRRRSDHDPANSEIHENSCLHTQSEAFGSTR